MSKFRVLVSGLGILLLLAMVITYVGGQANEVGSPLSTRVTVQPGDTVQQVYGLLPQFSLRDLIFHSDTIVIGTVTDILPGKEGVMPDGVPIIYTDVIVEVDRYLYGEPESKRVAIQVWGGRIGSSVMLVEGEAEFTVGEDTLAFLCRLREAVPPDGIDALSYYLVTGCVLGKFTYQRLPDAAVNNGLVQELPGQAVAISAIANQIAEIKG